MIKLGIFILRSITAVIRIYFLFFYGFIYLFVAIWDLVKPTERSSVLNSILYIILALIVLFPFRLLKTKLLTIYLYLITLCSLFFTINEFNYPKTFFLAFTVDTIIVLFNLLVIVLYLKHRSNKKIVNPFWK